MSDERYNPVNRSISKITLHSALIKYMRHLKEQGFSVTPMSSMSTEDDNKQVILTEIRTEKDGLTKPSLVYKRTENTDGSILEKIARVNKDVIVDPSAAVDNAEDYPLRIVVSTNAEESRYDERLLEVRTSQIDAIYRGKIDHKLKEYLTTTEAVESLENLSVDVIEEDLPEEAPLPDVPIEVGDVITQEDHELEMSVDKYLEGKNITYTEQSLEESIEDDEGIGLEISTMLQDDVKPEEFDWEVVCDGVSRTRLESIGKYKNPRTGESYDQAKIDNALMSVMVSCHDDLKSTIYEHFFVVVPNKGLAYNLGSRALFIEHEQRTATRGAYEKEELKEKLQASFTGVKIDPEQKENMARAINQSAENAPKYLSMARYCKRNKGRIQVYEFKELTPQKLLSKVLPKQGTIAVYSPDYDFVRDMINLTMKERGALRFEQVANLLEMSLTLEGRTIQFVGFGPRNVFEQYFSTENNPEQLTNLLLGDEVVGAMIRNEEINSGFPAPNTCDMEVPLEMLPTCDEDNLWEESIPTPVKEPIDEVEFTEPVRARQNSEVVVKKEPDVPEGVISLDEFKKKIVNGKK